MGAEASTRLAWSMLGGTPNTRFRYQFSEGRSLGEFPIRFRNPLLHAEGCTVVAIPDKAGRLLARWRTVEELILPPSIWCMPSTACPLHGIWQLVLMSN